MESASAYVTRKLKDLKEKHPEKYKQLSKRKSKPETTKKKKRR